MVKKTLMALDVRNIFKDNYNMFVAAVISVLSAVFGQYWYLFAAFFLFNIFDYCSGLYKARKLKIESSAAGLMGITKKLWLWVIVAVSFIIANTLSRLGYDLLSVDLSWLSFMGWFTLTTLAINEARSICENLVVAGIKVPQVLVKGLAIANKLLEDKAKGVIPDDNAGDR